MSPTQLLLREQAYNRGQFGVTYPFSQFRIPVESSYGIALNGQTLSNQGLRRADDYPQNLRSSLLEEFRSNQKGNKRYELRVCSIGDQTKPLANKFGLIGYIYACR